MGSGKTTLINDLKLENDYYGYSFYDLDDFIFESFKHEYEDLESMIHDKGFAMFRKLEEEALFKLLGKDKVWIALGGGTLSVEVFKKLSDFSGIKGYWLNTDFQVCLDRIRKGAGRPLAQKSDEDLFKIYKERLLIYKQFEEFRPTAK